MDYREWLKTHVFGEVPFRPKFTGWLKSLLPPKNWDYWAKRFDPEYLLNLPMIQSVDFAMNTQQQFIRPWERIYVDEIAAFTDKQYKYLSDKMKP